MLQIFKGAVLRYTHSYNIAVLGFVIRLKVGQDFAILLSLIEDLLAFISGIVSRQPVSKPGYSEPSEQSSESDDSAVPASCPQTPHVWVADSLT